MKFYKIPKTFLSLLTNQIKIYILKFNYPRLTLGKGVKINGKFIVRIDDDGFVTVGDNVKFTSDRKKNMVGIYKPCSIAVHKGARLEIGANAGFSGVSIVCSKKITIGKHLTCGANVMIWDSDFHSLDYLKRRQNDTKSILKKEITIGDDVFIGANAIITKGVKIGNRVIIGAGSVVTGEIPDNEIWGGNPAKHIRKIKIEND